MEDLVETIFTMFVFGVLLTILYAPTYFRSKEKREQEDRLTRAQLNITESPTRGK